MQYDMSAVCRTYLSPSVTSYCYTSEKTSNLGMSLDMNQVLSHMKAENRPFCCLGDGIKRKKNALEVKIEIDGN